MLQGVRKKKKKSSSDLLPAILFNWNCQGLSQELLAYKVHYHGETTAPPYFKGSFHFTCAGTTGATVEGQHLVFHLIVSMSKINPLED